MGVFPPITVREWTVGNTWASNFFLLLSFILFPPFRDASHCHFNIDLEAAEYTFWWQDLKAIISCWEDPLEEEMATHSTPGESHGQRSLVGSSPWGHKGLDTTEWLNNFGNRDLPKPIHRVSSKPSTALLGLTTPPGKHSEDRILTKISSPARLQMSRDPFFVKGSENVKCIST